MAKYKLPDNVEKIKHIVLNVEDHIWELDTEMGDYKLDRLIDAVDVMKEWYCESYGHDIVDDHCGLPEHRHCIVCATPEANINDVS